MTNRILTASAVAFPEPTLPPNHVPDWKRIDDASGLPICKRCDRPVGAAQWSGQPCPGKERP